MTFSEDNILDFSSRAYRLIEEKAASNTLIQGLTGVVGFPFTLLADGAVVFTHYGPMIDEIRALFGYGPVTSAVIQPIVSSISGELLFDLVADKVLGQIPIVGIYFNVICAKAMTWRLGTLFAMLAARGQSMAEADMKRLAQKIRLAFPQSDTMRFQQPGYHEFERLIFRDAD